MVTHTANLVEHVIHNVSYHAFDRIWKRSGSQPRHKIEKIYRRDIISVLIHGHNRDPPRRFIKHEIDREAFRILANPVHGAYLRHAKNISNTA